MTHPTLYHIWCIVDFRKVILMEAERQGLSRYRVGKLSDVPIRTVQRYLAGETDTSGERLAKIAEALGLELRPMRRRSRKGG